MSAPQQRGRRTKQRSAPIPAGVKKYVKQYVKSQLSADEELKHYPTVIAPTALSTTGVVQDLSVITQGTTSLTRVGDEVRAQSLDFTVGFIAGDATNFCRCTIIEWKMNDSNDAVTLSDVYSNYLNNPALSQISPTKPNRFRIIYDKTVSVSTAGDGAAIIRGHLKLNHAISYNLGANSGIGHLYMLLSSDSSAVVHPTYSVDADFAYSDA